MHSAAAWRASPRRSSNRAQTSTASPVGALGQERGDGCDRIVKGVTVVAHCRDPMGESIDIRFDHIEFVHDLQGNGCRVDREIGRQTGLGQRDPPALVPLSDPGFHGLGGFIRLAFAGDLAAHRLGGFLIPGIGRAEFRDQGSCPLTQGVQSRPVRPGDARLQRGRQHPLGLVRLVGGLHQGIAFGFEIVAGRDRGFPPRRPFQHFAGQLHRHEPGGP